MTDTPSETTEDERKKLVDEFLAARTSEQEAKAALDEQNAAIRPYRDAHRAAKETRDEARGALAARMRPGDRWNLGDVTVSLSRPSEKIVEELDTEALMDYLRQTAPELLAHFTHAVDKTPTPALRVQ